MAKKGKLTEKQQRFVDEYLIDLNATQAAIRAGYSVKTADAIGCENLTKPCLKHPMVISSRVVAERFLKTTCRVEIKTRQLPKNSSLRWVTTKE